MAENADFDPKIFAKTAKEKSNPRLNIMSEICEFVFDNALINFSLASCSGVAFTSTTTPAVSLGPVRGPIARPWDL